MKSLLILFLLFSQTALAFRLNTNVSAAFDDKDVKISVTSNSLCSNAGITNSELLSIAMDGADEFWNKVPTSNLNLENGGILETTDSKYLTEKLCAEDSETICDSTTTVPIVSEIVIACNSNATNFPTGDYLALSAPVKLSGSKIKGSIILINDSSNSIFPTLSRKEKVSVLAHEIGHAIGLGHSNKDEALMHYKNSDSLFSLSQDDIDGVTYLYPNKLDGLTDCSGIFAGTLSFDDDSTPPTRFLFSLFFGIMLIFLTLRITKIIQLPKTILGLLSRF
ncbi:MAG: hypothetical protein ACJAS4_000969 [Bacteriovoracaceae bacterium]|jgi:hypothetical protein